MSYERRTHHARIMIEGGCSIEDVCVTLGMGLHEAIYAVAPSLKANPEEQKRIRRMAASMKLSGVALLIHSRERSVDVHATQRRKEVAA